MKPYRHVLSASGSSDDEMDARRDAMRKELREIWAASLKSGASSFGE